jgi:hypothetical protein
MQTIETLWELATYAERSYGGDTEDLTPAACCMADAEGWDLNGLRDRLGEDVTEYARELPYRCWCGPTGTKSAASLRTPSSKSY